MTISDALPVQFWLTSDDTYNETVPEGVFRKCFCLPWKCSDTIKTQFLATTGELYALVAVDDEGTTLWSDVFAEIATGVYDLSLTPEDEDICDEEIQLKIVDDTALIINTASEWTNDDTGTYGAFDSKGTTTFTETATGTNATKAGAFQSAFVPVGTSVTIPLSVTITGTWTGTVNIAMSLTDELGNSRCTQDTIDPTDFTVNGTYTIDYIMTGATATSKRLNLYFAETVGSGSAVVVITIPKGSVVYMPDSSIVRQSDCLNIKTSQPETTLITYSNDRNFASLDYSTVSPDPEFTLRIPAIFYHERFPEESEVIELSNSRSIQLNGQVKAQRLLEINPMPYYMHRKLKLVLKHQTVTINSQDWVQSEVYELVESNRRSAMKKATVWLDEKDYIQRNVL